MAGAVPPMPLPPAHLRAQAIDALPAELQDDARRPDLTLFPAHRRVFTDTCAPPRPAARAVASVWLILLFSTSDFALGWRARRPPIADFEKKMRSRRGDMD